MSIYNYRSLYQRIRGLQSSAGGADGGYELTDGRGSSDLTMVNMTVADIVSDVP